MGSRGQITFAQTHFASIDGVRGTSLANLYNHFKNKKKGGKNPLAPFEEILGIRVSLNPSARTFLLYGPLKDFDRKSTETNGKVQCIEEVLRYYAKEIDASPEHGIGAPAIRSAARTVKAGKVLETEKQEPKKTNGTAQTAFERASNDLTPAAEKLIASIELPEIEARTENQQKFLDAVCTSEVAICIAPAGTGKTFLAVFAALRLLKKGIVNNIYITRPAVSAGEDHGYLPGNIKDKIDPYMIPIYKSLMKLLANGDTKKGQEVLKKLQTGNIIEISPVAFMRGNEFEKAAVLGDEFQNATDNQLKMFLTRLGEGGRMIIVGDPEQTDLEPQSLSALGPRAQQLETAKIDGLSVSRMTEDDAQRHRLIGPILKVFAEELPKPETLEP
jgi:phosphate starvation-inducible protein PhoH